MIKDESKLAEGCPKFGNCYYIMGDEIHQIDDKNVIKNFDGSSGNYHILPNPDSDIVQEKKWIDRIRIANYLISNKIRVRLKEEKENNKENNKENYKVCMHSGSGKSGCKQWISVKTNKNIYWLVFDTMYVTDESDPQYVNCIYGHVQFYNNIYNNGEGRTRYSPNKKTEQNNEEWIINYPKKSAKDFNMNTFNPCCTIDELVAYKNGEYIIDEKCIECLTNSFLTFIGVSNKEVSDTTSTK